MKELFTSEKIEEWLKEIEERPSSAPIIIQFIANRLRDLTERNEVLLEENITLKSGKQVKKYEKRIAHLKYQLDLLKRQLGSQISSDLPPDRTFSSLEGTTVTKARDMNNILVYNPQGRVLRVEVDPSTVADENKIARLKGDLIVDNETPRLLAVPGTEEILFIFTSGRVAFLPLTSIPIQRRDPEESRIADILEWGLAPVPFEPHAGETLACLAPISKMALVEYFVQISRRGCVKKIRASMAESILTDHYIGTGVKKPADETFDLMLCAQNDRLVLVSQEGYLLCLSVGQMAYSIEEIMRLGIKDHLVAAFIVNKGQSILLMAQVGKAIHRMEESIKTASGSSQKKKGQAFLSQRRREQGIHVVGAISVSEEDWGVALHRDGGLTIHSMGDLFASGTVPVSDELLAFTAFPGHAGPASVSEA